MRLLVARLTALWRALITAWLSSTQSALAAAEICNHHRQNLAVMVAVAAYAENAVFTDDESVMNDLIPTVVSPLRQRLIDDMTRRRFSRETERNYLRDVGRFATWLGRSPHTASAEDVRRFQIEQQEAGVPVPTMNSIVAAPRFFFTHALDRPDVARKLVRTAHARKIRWC